MNTSNTITETIEPLVRDLAAADTVLKERVQECQEEQQKILNRKRLGIRNAAERKAEAETKLREAIEQNRQCFKSPKTREIAGVKFGLRKGKGTITMPANIIDRIEKKAPDMVDLLITTITERKVDKKALNKASADLLRKLGCVVTYTGDEITITMPKNDVDKFVEAVPPIRRFMNLKKQLRIFAAIFMLFLVGFCVGNPGLVSEWITLPASFIGGALVR